MQKKETWHYKRCQIYDPPDFNNEENFLPEICGKETLKNTENS